MNYHLAARVDVRDQEAQTVLTNNITCASSQCHPGEKILSDFHVTVTDESGNLSSTDHDYCSSTEQSNTSQYPLLAHKLNSIGEKVKLITNIEEEHLKTTMKILDYVECCITGMPDEVRLTDLAMTLLQTHFQGYSIYSSTLLKTVSGWLGQQFSAANSTISCRVEGFKAQHIEHITDLPPPEELASELFPEAMRNLLARWMGLSEEADDWKRHSEYPILLLILEFANHNLITGVAHVLYSSLISK